MNKIKFTSKTTLTLTNPLGYSVKYKGYNLGELPPRFGYIYNDTKETFGIDKWFNYKGLTWIQE